MVGDTKAHSRFAGKFDENHLPPGPRAVLFRRLLPKVKELLRMLQAVGEERGRSAAQVAINWCLCKGTVPIPGVKNMKQAMENVGAIDWRLTDGEVAALEAAAERSGGKMLQNVFQTK